MGNCTSVKDKSSSKKENDNIDKYEKDINNLKDYQNKQHDNFETKMKDIEKQMNNFGFFDNENNNKENKNDNNNNKKVINNNKIDMNEKQLEDIEKNENNKQDDIFDNFEKQLKAFDF